MIGRAPYRWNHTEVHGILGQGWKPPRLGDRMSAMQAKEPVIEGRLGLVQLTGDEIEAGIVLTRALGGGYRSDDLPGDAAGTKAQ